eukprot:scaffold195913_cov28-Tisochrysis_lutea.AAC.3
MDGGAKARAFVTLSPAPRKWESPQPDRGEDLVPAPQLLHPTRETPAPKTGEAPKESGEEAPPSLSTLSPMDIAGLLLRLPQATRTGKSDDELEDCAAVLSPRVTLVTAPKLDGGWPSAIEREGSWAT